MAISARRRHGKRRRRRERASRISPDDRDVSRRTSASSWSRVGTPERRRRRRQTWPRPSTTTRPACSCSSRTSSAASKTSRRSADDRPRRRGAARRQSFDPISLGLLKRPGDYGRRHRRGRRANAGHADAVRRAVPGHHGLPRAVRPPDAGPHRRPDGRPPRQALLRAHAANPRAAHPPREGHEQHLHEPGPVRPAGDDLPRRCSARRACAKTAELCLQKSHYAAEQLCRARPASSLAFDRADVQGVRHPRSRKAASTSCSPTACDAGYLAGVPLGQWYPELADCFLVAVTEKRTKAEIDGLAAALSRLTRDEAARRQPTYTAS